MSDLAASTTAVIWSSGNVLGLRRAGTLVNAGKGASSASRLERARTRRPVRPKEVRDQERTGGDEGKGDAVADDARVGDQQQDDDEPKPRPFTLLQRLFTELIGTFGLTLVAAGAVVMDTVGADKLGVPAEVVAPGLFIMAMIYTVGDISGAHFNPVVTLAFVLRRAFPIRLLPAYWLAQLAGAVIAAVLLRLLFGDAGNVGATLPHYGIAAPLIMEVLLTFFLVTVIIGTATDHRLVGHNAALAVGSTIALDGLFAAPISGASMNPARSLGPAALSGNMATYWIYVVGPMTGAIAAVAVAYLLRGRRRPEEKRAAQGDAA